MTVAIYLFRNDLRLEDNPALGLACKNVDFLLPIYVHENKLEEQTQWGFTRVGQHRKVFLKDSLEDLRARLRYLGSDLFELAGDFKEILTSLRIDFDVSEVFCEQIEAPEELEQVRALKDMGFEVNYAWQSSMLDPKSLPFKLEQMPDIFTQFRQQVEKQKLRFASPTTAPTRVPPLPMGIEAIGQATYLDMQFSKKSFLGGESRALLHIEQYFDRRLPDTYKQTRNQLIGMDYSSKFSPWLALGSCSARSIAKKLTEYELQHGANDGTYWLWFELLWRDYFRFLHFKYGNKLYRSRGLSTEPKNLLIESKFKQWVSGNTGESLIDAGMHELQETGFLSNRMRQMVASYWIYNMKGDWQAGAAWFESQLVDYDVYSNQGNWLYIAGKGTDPRGGRPMNLAKQTQDHDPDGIYRKIWLS
jgi:deoxyribodipyrimidine photo-lyase